ncbi:phosphonate ABC transporter substrate-binding protein [Vibrio chagasii]|uniref:phosphonate ABC transporter substrate-binding protein n=1 Tax=Vibrio chagasii TaxID=170679 RepID=UPI0035A60BAA
MFHSIKSGIKKASMLATVLMTTFTASHAFANDAINFGIIATDAQQNLRQRWEPLLDDLGEALGKPVKAYFAPDYAGIIQAQRFGKVDFAYYGNKAAMEAVDRADAEVFARYIDADGLQGYYSLLIVNAENDSINTLQDVLDQHEKLRLGNGDPNSTSGFLVPNFEAFANNGVSANDFHRNVTASHGANVMAVANNQVDVATNHTMSLVRIEEQNPELFNKLKVVWQSELIPSDVITYRKGLDEELKQKAREFFVAYGEEPQQLENLSLLAWSGFAATDNKQLLPIRQMEAFKKLVEAENNSNLSEKDRTKRMAQYQAEIDQLQTEIDALKG